jgi:uncharacterized protein YhbP (UPF0306 family)
VTVPIEASGRRYAVRRVTALAASLLDASTLLAISTVGGRGNAYINTAYFAWGPAFECVWLSSSGARHSRNLAGNPTAAVAVYDSTQTFGDPDRGIQLIGSAREVNGGAADGAERFYAARFDAYKPGALSEYRFYRFRPRRLKLFDERELGAGVFVTARVRTGGEVTWERTEVYR